MRRCQFCNEPVHPNTRKCARCGRGISGIPLFQDYVVTIGCALIVLFLFVLFILLSSFLF